MKVTATELARRTKDVLDRVIQHGEPAEVQRHGRTVAKIRRKAGATREQMLDLLKSIPFSAAETRELKQAMDAASDLISHRFPYD